MSDTYVRLRPRSGKKNGAQFPLRFMIDGIRFDAERGWYRLNDRALIEKLSKLRLDDNDPDSPRIFDLCTEEEAKEIQSRERRSVVRRDVEDAGELAVTSPRRTRTGAMTSTTVSTGDVKPSRDTEPPPMIDPDPDGAEIGDLDAEDDRAENVGKLSSTNGEDEDFAEAKEEAPAPEPKSRRHTTSRRK